MSITFVFDTLKIKIKIKEKQRRFSVRKRVKINFNFDTFLTLIFLCSTIEQEGANMLLGYARVSTEDQNLDRQIDQLLKYGVDERMIYKEKISGTKRERPELNRLLNDLRKDDVLYISDLTRISRSTKDLLDIIEKIKISGAAIKSIKDNWLDTTSDNPYNSFLLTVMSGLSQLERDLISQRTKEGLKSAKARGRCGGRPSKQNEKGQLVKLLYKDGEKIAEICRQTGLSRSTVNRIIKKYYKYKV